MISTTDSRQFEYKFAVCMILPDTVRKIFIAADNV